MDTSIQELQGMIKQADHTKLVEEKMRELESKISDFGNQIESELLGDIENFKTGIYDPDIGLRENQKDRLKSLINFEKDKQDYQRMVTNINQDILNENDVESLGRLLRSLKQKKTETLTTKLTPEDLNILKGKINQKIDSIETQSIITYIESKISSYKNSNNITKLNELLLDIRSKKTNTNKINIDTTGYQIDILKTISSISRKDQQEYIDTISGINSQITDLFNNNNVELLTNLKDSLESITTSILGTSIKPVDKQQLEAKIEEKIQQIRSKDQQEYDSNKQYIEDQIGKAKTNTKLDSIEQSLSSLKTNVLNTFLTDSDKTQLEQLIKK